MSELTSEKIAKALKGAGLSSKQRIEKANEAWSNETIFFPNKDEFLFEWICSAFAKPNLKKLDDCCLLQLPYWNLLADLLQHYAEKSKDHKRSIPTIHVNYVLSVSTLLQLLYKHHLDNADERIRFLAVSYKCLNILLSESFNASYRPAFEHVTSAVDQALDSISKQIDLYNQKQDNSQELQILTEISAIAHLLLKKFDSQLVLAANQKKIFLSVVERTLGKFLLVRRRIHQFNEKTDTFNVSQIITNIVCHSLFHQDTVLEFTSVLKDANNSNMNSNNVKQTNYVIKLFEALDVIVATKEDAESMLDAVDILPVLLSAFLDAFRKKRNTSTSTMQDISRMAEFGMFQYLLKTLSAVKETHNSAYLETLCRLLQEILQWNVYSARNDDIAASQLQLLNNIANDAVTYLNDSKKYNQCHVLNLADTLLHIDFSLIETRVQSLWPIMLNSEDDAHATCLRFSKSLLKMYSASRQVDIYITDLISNIQHIQSNSFLTTLKKPMFNREFLNEFSSVVSKSVPVAQYPGIFTEFQDHLVAQKIDTEYAHKSKKHKGEKSKNKNKDWTIALTSMYFVEFIHAMKLGQHQLKNFESPVSSIYNQFIKPRIEIWMAKKSSIESTILPALQVHSALLTSFFQVYTCKFESKELNWLAQSYTEIFKTHIKTDNTISRLVIATCTNTMLQHAYYSTLLQNSSPDQATELVNLVVDFVTDEDKHATWYNTTQWDGSILGLEDQHTLKVACWKLLSDEWFESVVRFIDKPRAEKIASIIHMSLTNDSSSTSFISVQLLNKVLLRSANFYEAECFKECNIPIILNAFVELFNTKLKKVSIGSIPKATAKMVTKLEINKPFNIDEKDFGHLCDLLDEPIDSMDEDANPTTTNFVNNLCTLLKLLLLFPNEYIEKNERPQIIYLATLIDIWSITCSSADALIRMKVSLMCRALQLKLIDYFSTHSLLGLDYRVLSWLVSSNRTWADQKTVEFEAIYKSMEQETNRLDFLILRKIMSNSSAKVPDEHSLLYFKNTLQQRVEHVINENSNASLIKFINFLDALNLVLNNSRKSEIDLENAIYATKDILKVSQFIIPALENAKSTISELLEKLKSNDKDTSSLIDDNAATFKRIGYILHLTRLLQNYARVVGPTVDEVIAAQELSKTLTDLASPFIQFLQTTLSSKDLENNAVLSMTTDFIAAFCSILSRYQQVDTTKRILTDVWFVYSLVYTTGDKTSIETLSNAFASWIQSLNKDQYTVIIDIFLEQAEDEAINRSDVNKEQHALIYLFLFSKLINNCANTEKGRLRKQIPSILLKLSLVAGKTTNLQFLEELIQLLVQITGDQTYHMSDYDASIILSCLLQVGHPTGPDRFKDQLDQERANKVFVEVCSVLSNLVSHHKEQVVYMLPPFIAFVQSLLHCFKSTHVSLVSNTNSKKRKRNNEKSKDQLTGRSISLLQAHTPLDNVSAQKFARVLTTIPQKQHSTVQKNMKSAQSIQKMVAKHTPSILIEYFTIQSNATITVVDPNIKSILTNALYDILDLCSDNDRDYVLSCLDGPGKSLFKDFYNSWKENHKYSGQ